MYPPVETKDPAAVQAEVQAAYDAMFPQADSLFVPRAFGWAAACFTGQYRDYQPIDARYHDFEHTLQGTLCLARLFLGRHRAGAVPRLTLEMARLGLLAILFHDAGYLKRQDDREGTGAKYTVIHVERSAEFAAQLLAEKGFSPPEILAVQNMIHCTGLEARLSTIPFQSEVEKIAGLSLGTADLLGQMSAADYVDKLPMLYREFAEAARYSGTDAHFVTRFNSAAELMEKTPGFWENFVVPKLHQEFAGLLKFLNEPYPDGPNYYIARIEENMARIKQGQTICVTT